VTDVLLKAPMSLADGEQLQRRQCRAATEALKAMRPFVGRSLGKVRQSAPSCKWESGRSETNPASPTPASTWPFGQSWLVVVALNYWGKVRERVNYFYYLAQGLTSELSKQCRDGLTRFHFISK
jgi:hypothetical protein